MTRYLAAATAAAALILPAAADAHVTLQPSTAAAGGFTRLNVRVPNERDDASTTKIVLQLPDGFQFASYEPNPGWTIKVTKASDNVRQIAWTGKERHPARGSRTSGCRCRCPARRATRSPSRRCRRTPAARSCAGSAWKGATTRRPRSR